MHIYSQFSFPLKIVKGLLRHCATEWPIATSREANSTNKDVRHTIWLTKMALFALTSRYAELQVCITLLVFVTSLHCLFDHNDWSQECIAVLRLLSGLWRQNATFIQLERARLWYLTQLNCRHERRFLNKKRRKKYWKTLKVGQWRNIGRRGVLWASTKNIGISIVTAR